MKNLVKNLFVFALIFISSIFVACGEKSNSFSENIALGKTIIGEVEFENSEEVKLEKNDSGWSVLGEIESMSPAQKSAFGVDDVSHVVVLKFTFDKERTIDYFKIKGETTKVYSTDKTVDGYVGSISDLIDSEDSEDAFTYLVLSANTKEYILTSEYTDGEKSEIKLTINATLIDAKSE